MTSSSSALSRQAVSDWPGADQRHHLVEVGAEQLRRHRLPARRHPVDVAAHRVDLAVMADEPVRDARAARTGRCWSKSADAPAPAPKRSAGCADPRKSSRPAAPAAGPCRPRCGSKRTGCRGRAAPAARAARPSATTRFRICLRIVRIFRSNASWSAISGLAPTIAWAIHGIVSMTRAPRPVVSVGTSRQATRVCPSARMNRSICAIAIARACSSRGRKHIATA